MFVSNTLLGDVIGLTLTLTVLFIAYFKWTYYYWKRRNVPYLEPSVPFGNFSDFAKAKEHLAIKVKKIYQENKAKGLKGIGVYMFLSPNYIVIDLEYIKSIIMKDFQFFTDRNIYVNEKDDPLGASLAHITGQKWKNLRTKLTPAFSSGKIKMMFQTLVDCQTNMLKKMEKECTKQEPIDIKEILACFTTDIIGSVAFGLDCKTFEDEDSPFRTYGRKLFEVKGFRKWTRLFSSAFPKAARFMGVVNTPKDVVEFFEKIVQDTVNYRETNNYTRNDFMQLLINLKNTNSSDGNEKEIEGTTLTMTEVAAQSVTFFGGGFETSSTLMTFALYELSKHQDVQKKLRDEINTVLDNHKGKLTYEAIQDMKYLSRVIDETLRLHPPAPLVNRKCVKDYRIPETDIVIEKGISIIIPIIGVHYNEEYYPNPEIFDPERFSEENSKARPTYAHMPFGGGPRSCIGMRFALMQAKVGLTSLIKNFKFTVNKKTKEPLEMEASTVLFFAKGGIWLDAEKI